MGKTKKIVFIETAADAKRYCYYAGKDKQPGIEETLFLAMTPSAHTILKRRGFRTESTAPYFTVESRKAILAKSDKVMKWITDNSVQIDEDLEAGGIRRNSLIFYSRFAVHYYLRAIEIVLNAIEYHSPDIVCAPEGAKCVVDMYIDPDEGYLAEIVRRLARFKNIAFESFLKKTISSSGLSRVKYWQMLKMLIKYIDFRFSGLYASNPIKSGRGRPIIFTTKHYQMQSLALHLKGELKDKEIYFLKGPIISSAGMTDPLINILFGKGLAERAIRQKKALSDFNNKIGDATGDHAAYKGIIFTDLLARKLSAAILPFVLSEYMWAFELKRFFDRLKPSAIISNGNRIDDVIIAGLAKKAGVRTLLISHGSLVRPKDEFENIEWGEQGRTLMRMPFSHIALQTPLSEGFLDEFPHEGRRVITGPLIWGKAVDEEKSAAIFNRIFKGEYIYRDIKIVLHAGTPTSGSVLRPYIYESSEEYMRSIKDLAVAIEDIPDAFLIIKFRATRDMSINDLNECIQGSKKVIVNTDGVFSDLLGISDILVSFSSTTIEEALQNRIPVMLYGGMGRYKHVDAFEVVTGKNVEKNAAYFVRNGDHLKYAIRSILSLNMRRNKEEKVFDRFIYGSGVRESVSVFLGQNL